MRSGRAWHRLLLPLVPLYRGAVAARLTAYRRGWLTATRLGVPVVSVGNLSFGGTGKTPTVIALVRDLVRRGRHPAVLTRGYGRSVMDPITLIGPDIGVSARRAGDEPLEIAGRLPGVPVVVDVDRVRGGSEAVLRGADILVLDDGFQHLRLARDLDLVLVDAGDPWGGGRLAPRGRLREPLSGLARADAVMVTKVPDNPEPIVHEVEQVVRAHAPEALVLAARLVVSDVRRADGPAAADALRGTRVVAIAGLGRPQGFADLLRSTGAELIETRWFDDHHEFSTAEVEEAVRAAGAADAVVVTTAKDAVKMPQDAAIWVVEASMVPLSGSWEELWRLLPGVGS